MNVEIWQDYASCWSVSDAQRSALLPAAVAPGVQYRDPNAEVRGVAELAGYMADFQRAMPGHRFAIRGVEAHHRRSLARWQQLDAAGRAVADGISYAIHDEQGKLADITGFFAARGRP